MITKIPAPPKADPRGRRHSMTTVRLARQLYAGGKAWSPSQIQTYLHDRGVEVALNTIRLWVVPGEAEDHRERNLAGYHRRRQAPALSETPILDRMLALRAARLSFSAIAKVINVDHGLGLTTEAARYYVNSRREPVLQKRRMAEAAA